MTQGLPFRPRPQTGESALSVLRRGAIGNHHKSPMRLAYSLNPELDHSVTALGSMARSPERLETTFKSLGLPQDQIEQITYRRVGRAREDQIEWNGLRVAVGDLQFRRSKICVSCLREGGFAPSQWDHVASVACAKHQVLLDEECPCCGTPWTPNTNPLSCGCDLREMESRQERCSQDVASLLDHIISTADQAALCVITGIWSVLQSWRAIGIRVSKSMSANALWKMSSGRWSSTIETPVTGNSVLVHPRVALAALLANQSQSCRIAARTLLKRRAPDLIADDLGQVWWPASVAMAVLGTKRVAFEKLARAGLLVTREDGRYWASTINELLWRVRGSCEENAPMQPLSVHRAGPDPESLASLIGKIRSGSVRSYYCPQEKGLEGLLCEVTLRQAPPPTDCGLYKAAALLGTNTESVRSVIRLGLLNGAKGTARSAVEWCINPIDLQSFDERYVFASAVAKAHGGSIQTIASRLRSAGLVPVSGPELDGGVTYLFERSHLLQVDIPSILSSPYISPAGRKKNGSSPKPGHLLSSRQAGEILGVSVRQLRNVVRSGWIAPVAVVARRRMFDATAVHQLKHTLEHDYCQIQKAANDMGQSIPQFRRTWIDTRTVRAHYFADMTLIRKDALPQIREIWKELGTSSSIGRTLNRSRSLCPNLEKANLVPPPTIIGTGTSKVRLYSRSAPQLEKYNMT